MATAQLITDMLLGRSFSNSAGAISSFADELRGGTCLNLIVVLVNEVPVRVEWGSTVAVALLVAGVLARRSVNGSPRSPVCGMGV